MKDEILRLESTEILWSPDRSRSTNIDEFRRVINEKYKLSLGDYNELYRWSIEDLSNFWKEVWEFTQVVASKPFVQVLECEKRMDEIPKWFLGSKLNYAENLLRFRDDRIALYGLVEGQEKIDTCTFKELEERVTQYAAAIKSLGISCQDNVTGYIPNCIEAVVAMLATASFGGVWSSASPDFGVTGVLERFCQVQPKLLFTVDCVKYNGKVHDHLSKVHHVVQGLPGLLKVVVIPFAGGDGERGDISFIPNAVWIDDFLQCGKDPSGNIAELTYAQVPFDHPLFVMFSSGTTGVPKCILHSVGGTLLKHLEEHVLQGNMTRNDVIMYYTTTGWMMWNWLVTALAVGASLVLYDGSPLIPTPNALWDLVDKLGITILGTGAKWLAVLEDNGIRPANTHNLGTLHTILSTGSPLSPQSYKYVYGSIKKDVMLSSITGGTDIIACFAGQNPTLPVVSGEIQSRNLGCAIECWDSEGNAVLNQSGELVCTKPFPSMPTKFWNDADGSKYRSAYFSRFNGIWCHGDFCKINSATGGIVMLGRSDGTLNPNGVRFGSAEIYQIVEGFKEIEDSLCVAQRNDIGEERVVLFLKMAKCHTFTEDLVRQVQVTIRGELSARHVPAVILETKDIPYTISGKKVEVAVRDVIAGREVKHKGAMRNPQSLDLYVNVPELSGF